jgi:hypothetical protein
MLPDPADTEPPEVVHPQQLLAIWCGVTNIRS